jgi:hypothetical protein
MIKKSPLIFPECLFTVYCLSKWVGCCQNWNNVFILHNKSIEWKALLFYCLTFLGKCDYAFICGY